MPKPKITQQDINIFQQAVKGARPLIQRKVRLTRSYSTKAVPAENAENNIHLDESLYQPPVSGQEYIAYKHTSVSNKILRKLKKGQYNVEAVLDLHGMSIEKARIAVIHFLQQCLNQEIRVALIIHGKGRHHSHPPILKNKINHWLRQLTMVLAFCAATPSKGGSGALIILLKNTPRRIKIG
ncbi:MAG TPA: Smr/MutS family protein [Gammaproteobacteria bacterium]|nr:Smr/MutS family protein [Gammaproteobacteria bacterium]